MQLLLSRNRFCSFFSISVHIYRCDFIWSLLLSLVSRNHFIYLYVRKFTLYIIHVIVVGVIVFFCSALFPFSPIADGHSNDDDVFIFFLHQHQSTIINLVGLCFIISFSFCFIQHLPFAMPTVLTLLQQLPGTI